MGKIIYTIDEKKRIVNTKCTGEITLEELKDHADSVIHDPRFQKGMNSISDIRDADLEYSFSTFSSFRDHIRPLEQIRNKFKWTIIINTQKSPDAIELFQTIAADGMFSIKLFENRNEAENWISSKS